MANNRLYIKCKCGGHLYLGKHNMDGWHYPTDSQNRSFSSVLNEFYNDHEECFYKWFDNPFSIVTENEEEQNDGNVHL